VLRRHHLQRRDLQLNAREPGGRHADPAGVAGSRISRNAAALAVVSLLTDVSSEMTLTVLPLFLANVLGARTAAIGLIEIVRAKWLRRALIGVTCLTSVFLERATRLWRSFFWRFR